jgi:formamidopyrimidine-DNA glycosylase
VPEGIEIELYRRTAEAAVGRRIVGVEAPDAWFLKRGLTATALGPALTGRDIVAVRRVGKLLLLDTSGDGPVVGLRFGMTGRLVVDGNPGVRELEYSSARDLPAWDRFALDLAGGGQLRINDPRRLGSVELDPDENALGVDASVITLPELRAALAGSVVALKTRLMDQSRVGGIGNLLADEILWRGGPARRWPRTRRGSSAAPHDPHGMEGAPRAGRQPLGAAPGGPVPRRHLSARRRAARAPHHRWAHDVLVPAASALIADVPDSAPPCPLPSDA